MSFAATGGTFILGRANYERTTSTLTNTAGTPLALNAKAGTPALKVNNRVRVPNLNADTVDGLSAASFARTSGRTGSFDFPGAPVDLDDNGLVDTIVASGTCPAGTQLTGGGMGDFTSTGRVVVNGPDVDPDSWTVAVAVDETVTENPDDVYASVVCYSPTGAVARSYGAVRGTTAGSLSPALTRRLTVAAQARR